MYSNAEDIDPALLKMLREDAKTFKETHSFEERFL